MRDAIIKAIARGVADFCVLPLSIGFIWFMVNYMGVCEWAGLPRPDLKQIAVMCLFVVLVS